MLELRLPEYTSGTTFGAWARELILQLRRQWVPVLRRVQALSPYGLQTNDGAGTVFTLPWFKLDVAQIDVSVTATAVGLVRPGLTFAVFAQNLTAVVGPVDYDVGTTTPLSLNAWAAGHEIAIETIENTAAWIDTALFGFVPPAKYDAATDIVLTPNGGAFVSGIVKIFSLTLDFTPNA